MFATILQCYFICTTSSFHFLIYILNLIYSTKSQFYLFLCYLKKLCLFLFLFSCLNIKEPSLFLLLINYYLSYFVSNTISQLNLLFLITSFIPYQKFYSFFALPTTFFYTKPAFCTESLLRSCSAVVLANWFACVLSRHL